MTISKLPQYNEEQDDNTPEEGSVTVHFKGEDAKVLETLKDFCYQFGPTQQDTMIQALKDFFKDKTIQPRPELARNRKKVGRKRKHNF